MDERTRQMVAAQVGQALARHRAGDLAGAEALYRRILAAYPRHGDALHLYGRLLESRGALEEAIACVRQAIRANKEAYPYYCSLGDMLVRAHKLEEGASQYRAALRLKPDFALALNNLGSVQARQGRHEDAVASYRKALRYAPDFADAHFNLAVSLRTLGQADEAIAAYEEAVRLQPKHVRAWFNLGNALAAASRTGKAIAALRRARELSPADPRILTNLGVELMRLGQLEEAIASFRAALAQDPQDLLAQSNLILALSYAADDPDALLTQARAWSAPSAGQTAALPAVAGEGALRVGYVSADFREHAAAYWIEPLLAGHDRTVVRVHCYDTRGQRDATHARLRAHADAWIDCAGWSDEQLAARIREDGIQVLVDLSGHTDNNRLALFARRAAPLQVSWFGFPGTTGVAAMDYRLSDARVDPPALGDACYSERLVRLRHCFTAFRPHPDTPEPGPGPAERNGFVTFASFNNLAKLRPDTLAQWCELLQRVPDSRLLMQAAGLEDEQVVADVLAPFLAAGIDPARIRLQGWSGLDDYLRLGQQADIVLDTFPFNGGVTTCHALWMGLPVVTRAGRTAASRVGSSLLASLGLSELVAADAADYLGIALALAQDAARLAALRQSLRGRMAASPLLDGRALAQAAEQAFQQMWQDLLAGGARPVPAGRD